MISYRPAAAYVLAAALLLPAGSAFAQPATGYDQPGSQGYVQSGPQPGEPGYVKPKPKGGCLKYGAVGAVGGHLAHHGVLGAIGGCATGMYVKHRSKKSIRETGQP